MKKVARGVTLLELMIVIAIVALLASIAVPSYRNYVLRAQRSDATAALLRIAAAQEKFYLQNNTYTAALDNTGLNIGTASEHGWYNLSVTAANTTGFSAQATAPAASAQYRDTDCRTFTITETGARGATKASSAANTAACWR